MNLNDIKYSITIKKTPTHKNRRSGIIDRLLDVPNWNAMLEATRSDY